MPLTQYCQPRGLSVQSVYNAHYELAQKGRLWSVTRPAPRKTRSASQFVAVQMTPSPVGARDGLPGSSEDVALECASLPSPLQIQRTYPAEPFLAAVEQALKFGLLDLGGKRPALPALAALSNAC